MENLFLEADARKVFDGHSCPLGSSITGWQHLAIGSQSRPGAPLALFPRLSLSQLPLGQPLPSLTSAAAAGAHPCPKATLNQCRTWVFQVWVLCAAALLNPHLRSRATVTTLSSTSINVLHFPFLCQICLQFSLQPCL